VEASCKELHEWANILPRFNFDFIEQAIPLNGLYLLFEKGEAAHSVDRIVRVGTHTGDGQLRSRLKQHFLVRNKDRSIFRKNIGRALLAKDKDPFLSHWEMDLTPRAMREKYKELIDLEYQQEVESRVSEFMVANFSFAVVEIENKKDRLGLESKIISTVSHCPECGPSSSWLGRFSPKEKIRESGLWLVNELYKEPLDRRDFHLLQAFAEN
jgi:hypothetical protein